MRRKMAAVPFVVLLTLFFVRSADAYIDPGTGSYVLQTLLGLLFGLLYTVRVYWHQIVALVQGIFSRKPRGGKLEE